MKYSLVCMPLAALLLFGCNNSEQQQQTDKPEADSIVKTEDAAIEHVAIQPQANPDEGQYCYINKVYTTGDTVLIDADYIQFLMGKQAVAAAKKNGDAEPFVKNGDTTWSVPNDYYILNENRKIRTLQLAKDFRFIVAGKEDVNSDDISRLDYLKKHAKNGVFILTMDAGESTVSVIKEQYLP